MDLHPGRTAPTRRTLLRTSAWAAPAVIVSAAAAPAAATSGNVLNLLPGGSFAAKQVVQGNPDPSVDGAWQFEWSGASIALAGPGRIRAGDLTISVNWLPDTGFGSATSMFMNAPPAGFVADREPGPAYPSVTYVFTEELAPGASLTLPDGPWFGTSQPNNLQQGTFVITAAAPAFDSAVRSVHVPTAGGRLSFYTGAQTTALALPTQTVMSFAPQAQWYLDGPSVRRPGDGGEGMQVRTWFVPDPGTTDKQLVGYTPNGWQGSPSFNTLGNLLTWVFSGPLGSPVVGGPLVSGNWMQTAKPVAQQHGTYTILTTAPGYNSVVWRVHTP
jgi:hypothetical protein